MSPAAGKSFPGDRGLHSWFTLIPTRSFFTLCVSPVSSLCASRWLTCSLLFLFSFCHEQDHFPASRITYILPGQSTVLSAGGRAVEITATNGAVLGPPWQQAENGMVVRPAAADGSEKGVQRLH